MGRIKDPTEVVRPQELATRRAVAPLGLQGKEEMVALELSVSHSPREESTHLDLWP